MRQSIASGRSSLEIARSLERTIHDGRIPSEAPLPTVRELAANLGVSPATVAAAYRQLQLRGLVSADGRRGTRVRGHAHAHARISVSSVSIAEGLRDLASGNPDAALLPPLDSALRAIDPDQAMYGGAAELRSLVAFARSEFSADGIPAAALVVTSGALDAIERILREHLRIGDRVAVEDPGFPAILDLLAASGLVPEPVSVDGEGMVPDALEAALRQAAKAVIVTPRAQNPSGAALTPGRAVDLRRVLRTHAGVLLVENDPLAAIAAWPATTLTDGRVHWAVIRSTSKFLGPDLRVAVMAGDDATVARVRGRLAVGPRWVSHLLQQLVVALWADPSSARHLARVSAVYAQRRQALVDALAAHDISVTAPSGLNLWIPVRHEADVVQRLAEKGWAVAAGERFRIRSPPGIRITTSALEPQDAPRLAGDLAAVLLRGAPALA